MKQQNYKYQIALSFATQDIKIAEAISNALDVLDISNYLFTKTHTLGTNIKKTTWEVYHYDSCFAVMLISKHYVNKDNIWSTEEREVIQTVNDKRTNYIIPIRIDNSPVEGLTDHTVFTTWQENPHEIAILLARHIKENRIDYLKKNSPNPQQKKGKKKKQKNGDVISITVGHVGRDLINKQIIKRDDNE